MNRITMPALMKEIQIQAVDLVNIDVEGAEKEVWPGDWTNSVHCLMIGLSDQFRPGCSEAINSVVQEFSTLQRGETTLFVRVT
jgi:hypothetical protein